MIQSENDAAMALQISNALTQALLKYRLQNAPKEVRPYSLYSYKKFNTLLNIKQSKVILVCS